MKLWTYAHFITYIPTLLAIIAVAILLRKLLLYKPIEIRLIPYKILSLIIFGLEIAKQTISMRVGYDTYNLPFHFCSIFVFFIPLCAFCTKGMRRYLFPFTTIASATLFLFMLVCPYYAYTDERIHIFTEDFFSFHTVTFHSIVIFTFILIIALRLYEPNIKTDFKHLLIGLTIYCLIGGTAAQIFECNFNNFYYCAAEFVDNIRLSIIENHGWAFGQTVYVFGVFIVTTIFSTVSYALYRLINRFVNKC